MRKPSKPRFSPTRLAAFITCRTLYKYDYIDKIGRFYHKSSAGNSFGGTLHQALRGFHLAGGVVAETPQQLAERALENWRSAGYQDRDDEMRHRDLAVSVLENYHRVETSKERATSVFMVEKTIAYDMGSFILSGRVDRIDEHTETGALEIIDYKSGRMSITEDEVEKALAMSVYQLILKRLYPERRVLATIHSLRSGDSATVELNDEKLSEWEAYIRRIASDIDATDWEAVRPVFLPDACPDCDFLDLCTRYWKRQAKSDQQPVGPD